MKNNKFKKLIGKKSTGIVITILAFVIVFGAIFSVSNVTLAADSLPGIVDIRNDMTSEAYKVLEIVPDLAVAEFGFLVGGEEPLDVATLYDATSGEWSTWQEYLAKNVETMDETARRNYLAGLVSSNTDYISSAGQTNDKPMWYETYTEYGVTAATADGVIQGGNEPVYGWLIADDSRGKGWNAKFTKIDGKTYEEILDVAETTPYYLLDTTAEVALTDADITSSTYPDHFYTYKKDPTNSFYVASVTFGELKADIADGGLVDAEEAADEIGNYYILKFKMLTDSDDLSTGPKVYVASDFVYMETGAPYVIPEQVGKGHSLTKPAKNIYYQGGLFSNEMFKQHTLDIDPAEVANHKIDVQTVTAGTLNAMTRAELTAYLATVDFIYLNSGNSSYKYIYNNASYDLDNDAVELIFEKICNEKTPCIVDYNLRELGSLYSDISNTKAYALACMLMQSNYRGLLVSGQFNTSTISSNLTTWASSIPTTNSHNFVNGNVMVINSNSTNGRLTTKYYGTVYSDSVVAAAYKAVKDEIEVENLYRAADQTSGYGQLATEIHKSTVVRYIMNYVSARAITKKTSFEVLEIQPANVKQPGNSTTEEPRGDIDLTPAKVKTWLGITDNSVTVNITTMTTMEFIGTIEDLNSEYDLIYIGADIAGMTRTGNSPDTYKTNYLDDNMDGLIYTNVGGTTKVKAQLAGHLDTDWYNYNTVNKTVTARYNGNDITADKHNALVDYVKGTYPIVVSDKLCASTTAPTSTTVDNCTYLYSFLQQHLKDANVFKYSEVKDGNNNNFKFYANRAKLDIGIKTVAAEEAAVVGGTPFVQPGEYATGNDQTQKHVTYVSKESDGKAYLRYKFTITNNGAVYSNTQYTAALYLDSNSDGKFSAEYENISDIIITHVATGQTVKNGELVAGEQYLLTRQVPDTYSGLLTWKVEVSQTSNKFIRDSIKGYSRLKDTPKAKIKVLQVFRDKDAALLLEWAIGNTEAADGENDCLETLVWGGTYKGVYYEGITDEYQFEFTSIRNWELNKSFETGYLWKNNAQTSQKFNLMDYDMLILGFYDSYNLRDGQSSDIGYDAVNGTNGIKQFIDSGKSVLFAHDTTSVTIVDNYKNYWIKDTGLNIYTKNNTYKYDANVWGYYLNMYIRDMVGLDTYGITLTTKEGVDYDMVNSGQDLSESTAGLTLMSALKNTLEDGYYKIGLKPLAYKPNSNKTETVPETQGFCYGWMDYSWTADSTTYRNHKSTYNTYEADKVNDGAITTYPYYLGDHISIARTHHQYFTLDLNTDDDKDGETDLVVWFTMGGVNGDNITGDFNTTSHKDVMNNYYIYNKGNITYTGFGDFDDDDSKNAAVVVDECKLFVNTLVAAYNAAAKEPQVIVYESEDNLTPTTTFYEYGDADNGVAFRQDSQRMYFQVSDMNVIRGEKVASAEYYVALKPGTVSSAATTYTTGDTTYQIYTDSSEQKFIKLTNLSTYTAAGQTANAGSLQCGVLYYVDIPTSVFEINGVKGQNVNTFMLSAKTKLKKVGSLTGVTTEKVTSTTYHKIDFVHLELFPLD